MSKIDDDIEKAKDELQYYFRLRQKHLDDNQKFEYYQERCVIREEKIAKLYEQKRGKSGKQN